MGLMNKEIETAVASPVPAGLSKAAVIKAMHDQHLFVRLNDEIKNKDTDIKLLSGDPNSEAKYHCDDTKPGKGYDITITNLPEGVDTDILAYLPLGQTMKIKSIWRIVQKPEGLFLEEKAKIDGPRPVVSVVKFNIDSGHPAWHQKIFEKAKTLA